MILKKNLLFTTHCYRNKKRKVNTLGENIPILIFNKGFLSKTYKELQKFKKVNNTPPHTYTQRTKDLNRHFGKTYK
jgi:hypothetical protein